LAKSPFHNELEFQYFQLFRDRMTPHLMGFFESDFWKRLIFQASDRDPSVRHAIIAIGGLKAVTDVPHAKSPRGAQGHNEFALSQYAKAIQAMRKSSLGGTQDLRTTLINSLLIMCFESMNGNHNAASKQVLVALELLSENFNGLQAPASSKPYIEDELINTFERLDLSTMALTDYRSANKHLALQWFGQERVDRMPEFFSSMTEARGYLGLVAVRLGHWVHAALPDDNSRGAFNSHVSHCVPDEYLPSRQKHLDEFQRWHKAFQPLLDQSNVSNSGRDYLAAAALELLYLTSYFTAAVIRESSQPYPNTRSFMDVFTRMVSHSETILKASSMPGDKGIFMVDIQVICPLYFVAWRCPQRTLRRKAISLLSSYPRREAFWDSTCSARLTSWIMSLEEDNCDEEYIPEELKINIVTLLDVNTVSRRGHFRCMVPQKGSAQLVPSETIITW
jgi:Fungal specific transcription factor domain